MHLQTSRMVKPLATFITIMMQPIRVDAVLIPIGNLVAHMSLHVSIIIYLMLEHFTTNVTNFVACIILVS